MNFGTWTRNLGKFWVPKRSKKHAKNDLTAPIWTHRKQSWENALLEGKMDTKLKHSTWVRK